MVIKMDGKMIYLDLKQQKRTLEPNEFTIDASSDEAKAFFTSALSTQKLVIDVENKTTYFEEYELDEDGNFYSDYLADKVDGVYVPDLDTINAKQAELDATEYQRLRAAEYPSVGEQIDMMYHAGTLDGTPLYDLITEIKAKYPKEA